jgi:hypothetical protein
MLLQQNNKAAMQHGGNALPQGRIPVPVQGDDNASMQQGNNTLLHLCTSAMLHTCNMTAILYSHTASLHGCGNATKQIIFN